jgi:hypothetical protein
MNTANSLPELADHFGYASFVSKSPLADVGPDSSQNSAAIQGWVPGAHCCETVGFFEVLSAHQAAKFGNLIELFTERPAVVERDTWHRHFALDAAQERRLDLPLFVGCPSPHARDLAEYAPEGFAQSGHEARHIAYARSRQSGELASVMDLAVQVTSRHFTEDDISEPVDGPWVVDIHLSLNFIYTRCPERRTGAAAALIEFAGYILHREVERIIGKACPRAEANGDDVIIRVSLEPAVGSQGGLMMRGLLADTIEANISMMTDCQRWPHENFCIQNMVKTL